MKCENGTLQCSAENSTQFVIALPTANGKQGSVNKKGWYYYIFITASTALYITVPQTCLQPESKKKSSETLKRLSYVYCCLFSQIH